MEAYDWVILAPPICAVLLLYVVYRVVNYYDERFMVNSLQVDKPEHELFYLLRNGQFIAVDQHMVITNSHAFIGYTVHGRPIAYDNETGKPISCLSDEDHPFDIVDVKFTPFKRS